MVKYHKCHSILKLCNPGIPKPTGMAVPEETRSLFERESPRQGLVSKEKKTCQIALILRVYLASIYFSSSGGFCLQDLTIDEKKKNTHNCALFPAAQRSTLSTQWVSNSWSFLIPLCRSADMEFYFMAAKCKARDNGQKSCESRSYRTICPVGQTSPSCPILTVFT